MILTCDRGRGPGAEDWKHHGQMIAEADQIWMAVKYHQDQIARTMGALVGLDYISTHCWN